jgi:hypothetical protein
MPRTIDILQIGGFKNLIYDTILTERVDRDQLPNGELLARIRGAGRHLVETASKTLEGDPVTYVKIEWPEEGPMQRGMIFAFNPRQPSDPETATHGFYRLYTGAGFRNNAIVTWEQAEQDFHAYALASFGRPQPVEG